VQFVIRLNLEAHLPECWDTDQKSAEAMIHRQVRLKDDGWKATPSRRGLWLNPIPSTA